MRSLTLGFKRRGIGYELVLIALYPFAVCGYVTAAIAAYFVGRDRTAAPGGSSLLNAAGPLP
jgi:hypothetical protein